MDSRGDVRTMGTTADICTCPEGALQLPRFPLGEGMSVAHATPRSIGRTSSVLFPVLLIMD